MLVSSEQCNYRSYATNPKTTFVIVFKIAAVNARYYSGSQKRPFYVKFVIARRLHQCQWQSVAFISFLLGRADLVRSLDRDATREEKDVYSN